MRLQVANVRMNGKFFKWVFEKFENESNLTLKITKNVGNLGIIISFTAHVMFSN